MLLFFVFVLLCFISSFGVLLGLSYCIVYLPVGLFLNVYCTRLKGIQPFAEAAFSGLQVHFTQ